MVFNFGLYDSPLALILTYPTFLIPFCTWLLIGYFKSIPYELEECALIDGATRLQILWKITLPLAVPGLISAGIFAFTLSWNEFIYALAFIQSAENKTVPGRRPHPARRGRRLSLGLADGRGAAGLDPGRDLLHLLRRALCQQPDGGGEGVGEDRSPVVDDEVLLLLRLRELPRQLQRAGVGCELLERADQRPHPRRVVIGGGDDERPVRAERGRA